MSETLTVIPDELKSLHDDVLRAEGVVEECKEELKTAKETLKAAQVAFRSAFLKLEKGPGDNAAP